MKTKEDILSFVAGNHSYDSWYGLANDTHEQSLLAYTKEAMNEYAKQCLQQALDRIEKKVDDIQGDLSAKDIPNDELHLMMGLDSALTSIRQLLKELE